MHTNFFQYLIYNTFKCLIWKVLNDFLAHSANQNQTVLELMFLVRLEVLKQGVLLFLGALDV